MELAFGIRRVLAYFSAKLGSITSCTVHAPSMLLQLHVVLFVFISAVAGISDESHLDG